MNSVPNFRCQIKFKRFFPIVLFFTVGVVFSQENLFIELDTLMKHRNLIEMNNKLKAIDSTSLSNLNKSRFYYYLGTLSLFEDNNNEAVRNLIQSKKLAPSSKKFLKFTYKINDRLLESTGFTSEYSIRPKELIDENCKIARNLSDPILEYDCYYYLFTLEIDRGNHNQALEIMRECYNMVRQNKLKILTANMQSNIGHVQLALRNYDSVLPYFKKAEKTYLATKNNEKLAYLYNNFGNYYKRIGDYQKALEYLYTSLKIPLNQEEKSTKAIIIKNIADTHYFNKEFEKSALQYETFARLTDSLDRAKHSKNIQYYNTKYQTAEKEKQILIEKQKKRQNQNIAITLSFFIIFGGITAFLIQKNTRKKQRLAEQEKALESQKLATVLKEQELVSIDAMIEGQEKERQRIANDLHDDLGGLMATVKLHFNILKEKQTPELFDKTTTLLDNAYQKIRSIAHAKNSGVIAKQGLLKAVENMAEKISIDNKITIDVIDHGLDQRLENSLELTIFRIIQELVTNVIKHASANEATIHLTNHDDSLNIMIEDNGVGFNPKQVTTKNKGMGISSIDRRIEHLNGTMTIESEIKKGTTVIIDIPI